MAILFWYLFDTIFPFALTQFACFGPKLVIIFSLSHSVAPTDERWQDSMIYYYLLLTEDQVMGLSI